MFFKEILNLLIDNKKFPNYAAERRIDLFINMFLEIILTAHFGEKVIFVVPEFPLKRNETNNRTDKLDYLCAFEETKQPIFVELKTDVISFRNEQAEFYCEQAASWPACVKGLQDIINTRMRFSYREKYFQLIKQLLEVGLVIGDGANTSVQELTELSKSLGTPTGKGEDHLNLIRKKTDFSQGLSKLAKSVKARWVSEAKLLYLVPQDDKLNGKIKCACKGKACILDFARIEKIKV